MRKSCMILTLGSDPDIVSVTVASHCPTSVSMSSMYRSISLLLLPVPSNFGASLSLQSRYHLGLGGTMVSSSSGSETSGDLITDCMICSEPSKLSNVLGVADPNATTFCRPLSSEEFLSERRLVLVGYGLANGSFVLPVRLMMF